MTDEQIARAFDSLIAGSAQANTAAANLAAAYTAWADAWVQNAAPVVRNLVASLNEWWSRLYLPLIVQMHHDAADMRRRYQRELRRAYRRRYQQRPPRPTRAPD